MIHELDRLIGEEQLPVRPDGHLLRFEIGTPQEVCVRIGDHRW